VRATESVDQCGGSAACREAPAKQVLEEGPQGLQPLPYKAVTAAASRSVGEVHSARMSLRNLQLSNGTEGDVAAAARTVTAAVQTVTAASPYVTAAVQTVTAASPYVTAAAQTVTAASPYVAAAAQTVTAAAQGDSAALQGVPAAIVAPGWGDTQSTGY